MPRNSVVGSRSLISVVTGSDVWIELPKSSRTAWLAQIQYWSRNGLFRWYSFVRYWTSCGVRGFVPSRVSMTLPGARYCSENTTNEMTTSSTTSVTSRRPMNQAQARPLMTRSA